MGFIVLLIAAVLFCIVANQLYEAASLRINKSDWTVHKFDEKKKKLEEKRNK